MTFRHLEIFVAVYQERSITRAAKRLLIAQPAVSRYIRELEQESGKNLFERFARELHATHFGEEMYAYAARIVALSDQMRFAMENKGEGEQKLRVGSGTAIAQYVLPSVIKRFQALHPQAEISLVAGDVAMIEQRLMDNRLDFALMEWMRESPFIACRPLYTENIAAVCSQAFPLAQRAVVSACELSAAPLLLREPGCQTRKAVDAYFASHGFDASPLWESTSVPALLSAAREGLGVAFVTRSQALSREESGLVLLNVPDLAAARAVNLYHHRDKKPFPLMDAFLTHYRECVLPSAHGEGA